MTDAIHLGCIKDGSLAAFPRALVETIFGPHVVFRGKDFWRVRFADGSSGEIWLDQDDALSGVGFMRCGGEAFSNALHELLKMTDGVIYWPGGGCVVADSSVLRQLPPDMIEALGTPTVVKSGQEIWDAIAKS